MTVKLTPHAAELLESMRKQRQEPAELILEQALEIFANEQREGSGEATSGEAQQQAVTEMLDFIQRNRVRLDPGTSVKELIHEGHRV